MNPKFQINIPFFNGIGARDKAFFMRQLAVMVSSGVSIANALNLLVQQTENQRLRRMIQIMAYDVENGHQFSVAAARFPEVFDPVSVSMLKSAEATGKLAVILTQIADHTENSIHFTSKIRNAFIYPAFVVLVMIIVGIIMTTVIVPRLLIVFEDSSLKLPWMTRILIGISTTIIHYWYLIIILLAATVFTLKAYLATQAGKETLYRLEMKIPVIKNLLVNSYLTRFSSVFSMLIKSGVPFTDSLRIVSESMPSQIWVQALHVAREEVERGIPLSAALSRHPNIFPPSLTQMVAVGEQTGQLDSVLDNLSDFYGQQTDSALKAITTLIEPIVLVIVAFGVAFVVMAVIIPIYNLAESI